MSFLDRVIEQKKLEIERKRSRLPLVELRRLVQSDEIRDFRAALSGGERIIAELKKRSPQVSEFRQAASTGELAAIYERSGAAAVSVVVDEVNFGSSLADAQRVHHSVSLPVLVKDFVIDPYQVYEARAFDADAVLLIGRILDREKLGELLALVHELGMTALLETHSPGDIEKAADVGAEIIGINNRDLDTLDVSLETTRGLISRVPRDRVIVSESGINRREEIEELAGLGVDAFLIGGALLESEDPGERLQTLLGNVPRGLESSQ